VFIKKQYSFFNRKAKIIKVVQSDYNLLIFFLKHYRQRFSAMRVSSAEADYLHYAGSSFYLDCLTFFFLKFIGCIFRILFLKLYLEAQA